MANTSPEIEAFEVDSIWAKLLALTLVKLGHEKIEIKETDMQEARDLALHLSERDGFVVIQVSRGS